jgi:hypothetical protein
MAIPDLNAPPKGEEELPNLNKNPAQQQQEDGGPLQEVVRAGEGGGQMVYLSSFIKEPAMMSKSMEGPPVQDINLASIFMKLMNNKYFVKVSTSFVFKILLSCFYFSLLSLKICVWFHCLQKRVP